MGSAVPFCYEAYTTLRGNLQENIYNSKEYTEATQNSHKGIMAEWAGLGEYYSEPHWTWGLSGLTGNYCARFAGELLANFDQLSDLHRSTAMGECLNQRNRYCVHFVA